MKTAKILSILALIFCFAGSVRADGIEGSGTTNRIAKFVNVLMADTERIGDSDIYESGGKVGIGTTNPGAKLEVNGQVKITGGSPGAGKVLTSDASGLASWQTFTGGGGLTLPYYGTVSTNDRAFRVSNTYTGAGASYSGFFYAAGEEGRGVFGQAAGISGMGVKGWASNSGSTQNYGGHFCATGGTGIGVYGWAENTGNVENYGGKFLAEGQRGIGIQAKGGPNGSAGVFEGNIKITGTNNGIIFPDGTKQTTAGGGGGSGSGWIISGNNMYSGVSGNIGIGTTEPDEKLVVQGTIKADITSFWAGNSVFGRYCAINSDLMYTDLTPTPGPVLPRLPELIVGESYGYLGGRISEPTDHFPLTIDYSVGAYGEVTKGAGRGVYGLAADANDVTTSYGGYFEARGEGGVGVYAEGGPSGLAAELVGDVEISGSGSGIIFPDGTKQTTAGTAGSGDSFPRPAWDSGWIQVDGIIFSKKLYHSVFGSVDNYVVDMQQKSPDGSIKNGDEFYDDLTNVSVRIVTSSALTSYVRIRIWVYN